MRSSILIAGIICLLAGSAFGMLVGSGSEGDPYLIQSFDDLVEFADISNASTYWVRGAYTRLEDDLYLDPALAGRERYLTAVVSPDEDNLTFGFQGTSFEGVFDGNGHSIFNMTIDTVNDGDPSNDGNSFIGMFGVIGSSGIVRNLSLDNASLDCGSGVIRSGAICGRNNGLIDNCDVVSNVFFGNGAANVSGFCGRNSGTISNCSVDGTVSTGNSASEIGGLCGRNNGTINDSYNSGVIDTPGYDVGGVAGSNPGGVISHCYNTGSMTGDRTVGGVCGSNTHLIERCYNTAEINSTGVYDVLNDFSGGVGGVVGYVSEDGRITECYNTGSINSAGDCAGGIAGINTMPADYNNLTFIIERCYNTGTVSGRDYVGGVVGNNINGIRNCYSRSSVTGVSDMGGLYGSSGSGNSGAIMNCYCIGEVFGDVSADGFGRGSSVSNCFWDGDVCNIQQSTFGRKISTIEMQDEHIYSINGWGGDVWVLDSGNDYPRLAWEGTAGVNIPTATSGQFGLAGEGSSSSPYQISTPQEYSLITRGSIFWDKNYILVNDIDLAGVEVRPIGEIYSNGFTGDFDGNGYTVNNLTIDLAGSEGVGMFGYISNNGNVHDLSAENLMVVGRSDVGGLCGLADYAVIDNCNTSGEVYGAVNLGGLCGKSRRSTVTNCYSNCDLVNNGVGLQVGGLCGASESGTTSGCHATGNITSTGRFSSVGGLIGSSSYSISVTDCYATGSISSDLRSRGAGGLFGNIVCSTGGIDRCYSDVEITVGDNSEEIGGLCGRSRAEIIDSYSMSNINCLGNVYHLGGLCGMPDSFKIKNCHAAGTISIAGTANQSGGFCGEPHSGEPQAEIIDCFWDVDTTGFAATVGGGTGLSTADMQDIETYLNAGWDFVDEVANGTSDIWQINDGVEYPKFGWHRELTGSGTAGDPFVIDSVEDMLSYMHPFNNAYYWSEGVHTLLGADIYLDGEVFVSALISPDTDHLTNGFQGVGFAGQFNGAGHVIANVNINTKNDEDTANNNADFLGFFGMILEGGRVSDLGIENISIRSGKYSHRAGGLCGRTNGGTISGCYVTGNVSVGKDSDNIGGFCGINNGGVISDCYAMCDIEGRSTLSDSLGVFCGKNSGSIARCYSAGRVVTAGESLYLAGFCGFNNGGIIEDSFWDAEVLEWQLLGYNGTDPGMGLAGLDTAGMQSGNTYLTAGWDFVDETVNGVDDIWKIRDGVSYPHVSWRSVVGDVAGCWRVDMVDLAEVAKYWGQVAAECDFDESGVVDMYDVLIVADHWLER